MLENEILPLYNARGDKKFSEEWVRYIKNSIAQIAPHFTMKRQLDDYYDRFYSKLSKHFHILADNGCAMAKSIADWKVAVKEKWDSIEVKSVETGDGLNAVIEAGKDYEVTVVVDEKGLTMP